MLFWLSRHGQQAVAVECAIMMLLTIDNTIIQYTGYAFMLSRRLIGMQPVFKQLGLTVTETEIQNTVTEK